MSHSLNAVSIKFRSIFLVFLLTLQKQIRVFINDPFYVHKKIALVQFFSLNVTNISIAVCVLFDV